MAGILDKFRLDGRKAIITGGARGIGAAVAKGFAEVGADVAIVDIAHEDQAKELVAELKAMGSDALFVHADVTKKDSVQKMVDQVTGRWGRIDILFNNAGTVSDPNIEDMTEKEWDDVIDVNLKGVFLCSQIVGRHMIKQKSGVIVNTGSMSGYIVNYPQPQISYNPSKAGVHMFTKCLATEWAKYNIRVNAIAPGYIKTELTAPFLKEHPDDVQKYWIEGAVQNRIGEPEELVGAVIYLASDASTYTTGEVITIDGGFTLR